MEGFFPIRLTFFLDAEDDLLPHLNEEREWKTYKDISANDVERAAAMFKLGEKVRCWCMLVWGVWVCARGCACVDMCV